MEALLAKEYRCQCGKLLLKGIAFKAQVEFKCLRCKRIVKIDGISMVDDSNRYALLTTPSGEIVNASMHIEKFLGFGLSELVGKNISELAASEIDKNADKIITSRVAGKKYLRLDLSHKSKTGKNIPVNVRYSQLKHDGKDYIFRIADVNDDFHKKDEADLVFDKDDYADFYLEFDGDINILYISSESEKIFGFRQEELIGRKISDFYVPEDIEFRAKNFKALFARKAAYRVPSFRTFHKNGTVIYYEAYCSPIFDEFGYFVGYKALNWLKKDQQKKQC